MKYLFGPVNSRRLGLSQGIDLLPPKICNFNCIYCEIGPTTITTCERKEYTPTHEIIAEIDQLLADQNAVNRLDVFTITASGEPTLHSGIGQIIRHIKNKTNKPVAILTNGSLFDQQEVQEELMPADIIIPSLDSARQSSYRKINRPEHCAKLEAIIDGLKEFAKKFKGELWLEVLLAKGINDSPEDINALKNAVQNINPNRIQLNTVARPPLENFAKPLSQEEMESIASQFDQPVEILVDFTTRNREKFRSVTENDIIHMLKRRPCTSFDVSEALNLEPTTTEEQLKQMEQAGQLTKTRHHDKEYYQIRK